MSRRDIVLKPSEVAEFVSYNRCQRYAKHEIEDINTTAYHRGEDFTEAFNPLNILLSEAGEDFEDDVNASVAGYVAEFIDSTDTSEDVDGMGAGYDDHELIIDTTEGVLNSDREVGETPTILYQASIQGTIQGWDIYGDSDHLFIWKTDNGVELRVIDVKRTTEEKVYHQVQASMYAALLKNVVANSRLDSSRVTISGGVITQESELTPPTIDTIPGFDVEPRIRDIQYLLSDEGDIVNAFETDFEDVPYQLNSKCHGCPYNEGCVTESYEEESVRLLGLSEAQQEQLAEHGIEKLSDLTSLCRTPDVDEWKPTNFVDVSMAPLNGAYNQLSNQPGIGEQLPQLVYRAEALLDNLTDEPSGVADRPRNWIPGTGGCELPDDEPPEAFQDDENPLTPGSMIRVYLNVQYDFLRDRLIQLSARVTATASDDTKHVSVVSDGAPDNSASADIEQELLTQFTTELFTAIRAVEESIEYTEEWQENPPIHLYSYSDQERKKLIEAFDRHGENPTISAFRELVEGIGQMDDGMWSAVKPVAKNHIQLSTPTYGLVHAYDELQPPREAYSKPRGREEWSYSPADSDREYYLRDVFGRRLFNTKIAYEYVTEGEIQVDPNEPDYTGLKSRMRSGADIPLGYLWSAVGKIDEEWMESVDDSSLAEFEISAYRFRNNSSADLLHEEDITELGKAMCDMLEHVERSLVYSDSRYEKTPYPIETLHIDQYQGTSLAEGARRYLFQEYASGREEKYDIYRNFPTQRLLSGESVPVKIERIEEIDGTRLRVEGMPWFENQALFGEAGEQVRNVCRRKGREGESSGSWMVANPFNPGHIGTELTKPYEIERGVNTTIERLDLQQNEVAITLSNYWGEIGNFDVPHRKWTTDSGRAQSDRYELIQPGDWLILDPQTDDITAGRIDTALDFPDSNGAHKQLESIRVGGERQPETRLWNNAEAQYVTEIVEWLTAEVNADTYPSEKQQQFIDETESSTVALQGPPGTGKTAATLAPSLIARAFASAKSGKGLNALVTAPSNTAIREVMEDVVDLLSKTENDGPLADESANIELVRIADEPDEPLEGVTYVNYVNDDDIPTINRIGDRIRSSGLVPEGERILTDGGDRQVTFSEIEREDSQNTSDGDREGDSAEATFDGTVTLVFATDSRSWGLMEQLAPDSSPDPDEITSQSLWDVLAVDEASMMQLPNLLLAGTGFKPGGQLLVSGDHRQLPPVQKHDWSEVTRRDIRETATHLSTLDYIRLLAGDDVLGNEQEYFETAVPEGADIPFIRLDTTFRFGQTTADLMQDCIYHKDGIQYSAAREPTEIPDALSLPEPLSGISDPEVDIVLITYNSEQTYRQWNAIETYLSDVIVSELPASVDTGIVTPHNSQKGNLKQTLDRDDIDIDTVNRFQGGQKDVMLLNATVSDPGYIEAESDFLLQENRVNVAMTRHQDTLVVLAPETLINHLTSDVDLYEESLVWKRLAMVARERDCQWSGSLREFQVETKTQFQNKQLNSIQDATTITVEDI